MKEESRCLGCNTHHPILWRELDMNESIRESAVKYISPVCYWYKDLDSAMKAWDTL